MTVLCNFLQHSVRECACVSVGLHRACACVCLSAGVFLSKVVGERITILCYSLLDNHQSLRPTLWRGPNVLHSFVILIITLCFLISSCRVSYLYFRRKCVINYETVSEVCYIINVYNCWVSLSHGMSETSFYNLMRAQLVYLCTFYLVKTLKIYIQASLQLFECCSTKQPKPVILLWTDIEFY